MLPYYLQDFIEQAHVELSQERPNSRVKMLLFCTAMKHKSKLSLRQPFPTLKFGMMGVVVNFSQ